MTSEASTQRRGDRGSGRPTYIHHSSFEEKGAARRYAAAGAAATEAFADKFMPDEVTRDYAARMHYAGYRWNQATAWTEAIRWEKCYFALRDQIVLGNRKLIYRAVRRRMALSPYADDLIGDCHIVMIQAVVAYNPWLNIRFSTYAFTCLARALSRMSQRLAADKLAHSLSLDNLGEGIPNREEAAPPGSDALFAIDAFLHADHPLLSQREKSIIRQRFYVLGGVRDQTLEKVGETLGLSKERVRQVQAIALEKIRGALRQHFRET
jgi:RNA polymerase nonessential primary-like sigma factor